MNKPNPTQSQPKKHNRPILPSEAMDRLNDRVSEDNLDVVTPDEVSVNGVSLGSTRDANFESELEYDGYRNIQEYDNTAYGANVDGKERSPKELNFDERKQNEIEFAEMDAEENLVDPQEQQRQSNPEKA
jgi:hypothetical protein